MAAKKNRILTDSEQICQFLSEHTTDLIWSFDLKTMKLTYASKSIINLTGITPEEATGLVMENILAPDSYEQAMSVLSQELEKPVKEQKIQLPELELKIKSIHGKYIWANVSLSLVHDETDKTPIGAIGIARDISARKQAEETLLKNKETVSTLLNATHDMALLIDAKNHLILEANEAAAGRLGKTVDEYINTNVWDYFEKPLADSRKAWADKVVETGIPVHFQDERMGLINDINLFPVFGFEKEVEQIAIFARDITERKKAAKRERFYQTLVELSPDAIIVFGPDGIIIDLNPLVLSIDKGIRNKEEMIGKKFLDYLAPEERKSILELKEEVDKVGIINGYETTLLSKDGSSILVEISLSAIQNPEGQTEVYMVVYRDITEQRIAEKALIESEETARALLNASSDSVLLLDIDGAILAVNDMALSWLVRTFNNLIGERTENLTQKSILLYDYLPQEDVAERKKITQKMIETGEAVRFEYESEDRIFDYKMYPVTNKTGKLNRVAIFARDITSRKRTEEALQYRVEFERLIGAISATFINLHSNEIDIGIVKALEEIGKFGEDDMGFVFQYGSDRDVMINTHRWRSSGITPAEEKKIELHMNNLSWFREKIARFEIINVPDVQMLPPEASLEKKMLINEEVQSFIVIPMMSRVSLLGFIGFGTVSKKKQWPEEIIPLYEMISLIFANLIERKQIENELIDILMSRLSDREVSLLQHLADGHTWPRDKRYIARAMDVLPGTLDKFMARIKEKMNLEDLDKLMKVVNIHLKSKG
ncbi:MAG: PAS domain S-box protein [bacterium]|nr:PAS domain S-box protein [bacterium]